MKNIIFTLTILLALSCKAQSPVVSFTDYYINNHPDSDNIYVKDTEGLFNPFIGSWTWINGNNSLTINLFKVEMVYYESSTRKRYRDRLYGKIKYIENGQEVFNTLVNGGNTLRNKSGMPTNEILNFTFKDPVKIDRFGQVKITLFDNNTKAKFYLKNNEGIRVLPAGQTTYDAEFSMPRKTEFILNKL